MVMSKFVDGIVEFMGRGSIKRIESIKTSIKDIENGYVEMDKLNKGLIQNLEDQIEVYKDMVESRDNHIKILNDHIVSQNNTIIILKFNLENK